MLMSSADGVGDPPRKLVIGSSIQHSSGTLFVETTPLLKEKWHARLRALVADRVHAHHLWSSPAQRLGEFVRNKAQVESLFVGVPFYAPEPLGEHFGVAVFASGTDLCAPTNRIPGRVRPLDGTLSAHIGSSLRLSASPVPFVANCLRGDACAIKSERSFLPRRLVRTF